MNETEQVIDGLDEVEIANTSIDEIDSENINLIFVGIDKSGSMGMYERDMVKALSDFKDALINSKECDEILVARADFSDSATVGAISALQNLTLRIAPMDAQLCTIRSLMELRS